MCWGYGGDVGGAAGCTDRPGRGGMSNEAYVDPILFQLEVGSGGRHVVRAKSSSMARVLPADVWSAGRDHADR